MTFIPTLLLREILDCLTGNRSYIIPTITVSGQHKPAASKLSFIHESLILVIHKIHHQEQENQTKSVVTPKMMWCNKKTLWHMDL